MNEQPPRVTRRRALTIAMAGGLLAAGGSMVAIVGSFLKPKQPTGFGAPVYIGLARDFRRGDDPVRDPANQFWLANLNPEDTGPNGPGGGAGLLACFERCPHLKGTVEWRPELNTPGGLDNPKRAVNHPLLPR